MGKSNAKVNDRQQLNEIAKLEFGDIEQGLNNLITIRANAAAEILTTGNYQKIAEKRELINGITDRIKEILILDI